MPDHTSVRRILPDKGWPRVDFREIWEYRDLLMLLVVRNISVRYRQSLLGIGWALIRPITSMVIFTVIFGNLAKLPTDGAPAPLFYYSGMLPWLYFSSCLTQSSGSLVAGTGMLTKIYFPRLLLPFSTVVVGLVDFLIQFVILVLMMVWYSITPTWNLLMLPLLILLCPMAGLAAGLWLTSLNVKYRDIQQMVPFLSQIWMWLTPVVYPLSMITSEKWRLLYGLNPMAGITEGFRWALLGNTAPNWGMMGISFAVVTLFFVGGLFFFRRTERYLVDVI